jgi:hypothetical protein
MKNEIGELSHDLVATGAHPAIDPDYAVSFNWRNAKPVIKQGHGQNHPGQRPIGQEQLSFIPLPDVGKLVLAPPHERVERLHEHGRSVEWYNLWFEHAGCDVGEHQTAILTEKVVKVAHELVGHVLGRARPNLIQGAPPTLEELVQRLGHDACVQLGLGTKVAKQESLRDPRSIRDLSRACPGIPAL